MTFTLGPEGKPQNTYLPDVGERRNFFMKKLCKYEMFIVLLCVYITYMHINIETYHHICVLQSL